MPQFNSYRLQTQQNPILLLHFPYQFQDHYLANDDTEDAPSALIRQRERNSFFLMMPDSNGASTPRNTLEKKPKYKE